MRDGENTKNEVSEGINKTNHTHVPRLMLFSEPHHHDHADVDMLSEDRKTPFALFLKFKLFSSRVNVIHPFPAIVIFG